jgi:hypothetical protein
MAMFEELARQQIAEALCAAGGAVQDSKKGNLYGRRGFAVRELPLRKGHGTLAAATSIYSLLKHAKVQRALFIADRGNLSRHAEKASSSLIRQDLQRRSRRRRAT